MNKLERAIARLAQWRKANKGNTGGRCLAACRLALADQGIRLPQSDVDYPGQFAITCFETLAANPGRWGWKQIHHNADGSWPMPYALVFFKQVGKLTSGLHKGQYAGHVAILSVAQNKHFSNANYMLTPYWAAHLVGAFSPA